MVIFYSTNLLIYEIIWPRKEISKICKRFGKIWEIRTPHGEKKGYVDVIYENWEDAKTAKDKLDMKKIKGNDRKWENDKMSKEKKSMNIKENIHENIKENIKENQNRSTFSKKNFFFKRSPWLQILRYEHSEKKNKGRRGCERFHIFEIA